VTHHALITGIAGFAGGFLAEHLLQCGDAVLGCSATGQWEWNSNPALNGRVNLVTWDCSDSAGLSEPARQQIEAFQADCIYHLAAVSVPVACGGQQPTAQAMAVNVEGVHRVLELAAALPSHPRVLVISSSHVYAASPETDYVVAETSRTEPSQGYGKTKLAAEEAALSAVQQLGVDAVIVRPFQHAGPRQSSQMMLAEWARQLAEGGSTPIRVQTRDAYLDLSDVRDVVRAYRLLIERGRAGEVYNVGSGVCRRSGEVLAMLCRMAGGSRAVVETRPGVKPDSIANTAKIRQITQWHPDIPLETTLADTLAWWTAWARTPHN
jgi:GDP-4-dehydro-6-deoxy-D-mannose reductase